MYPQFTLNTFCIKFYFQTVSHWPCMDDYDHGYNYEWNMLISTITLSNLNMRSYRSFAPSFKNTMVIQNDNKERPRPEGLPSPPMKFNGK